MAHPKCGERASLGDANQQKRGDSPIEVLVVGFQERSTLKVMGELRRFITVDNHEAVKVVDLERNMAARPVVKPKFTTDFPEAHDAGGSG